jgi:hypothetical protein
MDTRSDNLAIFSDGHKYCFGCGFYVRIDPLLTKARRPQAAAPIEHDFSIPSDASPDIPFEPMTWMRQKCLMSLNDIINNTILWSEKYKWLIFPVNHTGFQARNFDEKKPYKWFSKFEKKDLLHVYSPPKTKNLSSIVVVEDIVSAIRVGNYTNCAPLFGSILSDRLIIKIKKSGYQYLNLWLDHDKMKESIMFSQRCRELGLNAGLICTIRDPKEHTNQELSNLLGV